MLYSLPGNSSPHPLASALMKVKFYSVSRLNHKCQFMNRTYVASSQSKLCFSTALSQSPIHFFPALTLTWFVTIILWYSLFNIISNTRPYAPWHYKSCLFCYYIHGSIVGPKASVEDLDVYVCVYIYIYIYVYIYTHTYIYTPLWSVHLSITVSIPRQDTSLDSCCSPQWGHIREASDQCISHTSLFLSLSFSLLSFSLKMNKYNLQKINKASKLKKIIMAFRLANVILFLRVACLLFY